MAFRCFTVSMISRPMEKISSACRYTACPKRPGANLVATEAFQLRAKRWRGQTQLLASFRVAACAHDRPDGRMKKPFKDVIRYIFVTISSMQKCRKLRRQVTN